MPNSQTQYQDFLRKKNSGSAVNISDLAAAIDNEEARIFLFMADNDLPQLWSLLHASDSIIGTIGNGMSFEPNYLQAISQLNLIFAKKDFKTLNDIISHFNINMYARNYTTNAELIKQLQLLQTIVMRNGSFVFNILIK